MKSQKKVFYSQGTRNARSAPYNQAGNNDRKPRPQNWSEWKAQKDLPKPGQPQAQVKPVAQTVHKPLTASFVKKDTLHTTLGIGVSSSTQATETASTETISSSQTSSANTDDISHPQSATSDSNNPTLAAPKPTTDSSSAITSAAAVSGSEAPVVSTSTAPPPEIPPGPETTGSAFHTGIENTSGGGKSKVNLQSMICEICQISVNSKQMLDAHLAGKKHKKKYEIGLKFGTIQPVSDPTKAAVFNPTHSSQPTTSEGAPVRVLEPTDAMGRIRSSAMVSHLYCGICEVSSESPQAILDHINGKRHLKKEMYQWGLDVNPQVPTMPVLSGRGRGGRGRGGRGRGGQGRERLMAAKAAKLQRGSKQYFCDVCDANIIGDSAMRLHLAGLKHQGKCRRAAVGPEYLVAKGKWAVPADDWNNYDIKEMERKRRPKDDGGWGMVRDGVKMKVDRSEAFVGPPDPEPPNTGPGVNPYGGTTTEGFMDFTQDVF